MTKWILFLIIFSLGALAQSEREFRKLFSDKEALTMATSEPDLVIEAAGYYKFDLDGDKKYELIKLLKKDGINFVQFLDTDRNLLKEVQFQAKGIKANLYKLRSTFIKKDVLTIVLYFDEGFTKASKFKNTARVYFLTVKNNNWLKARLTKGPAHFIEQESVQGRYFKRGYQVNIQDLNSDGVKEIEVSYGSIQRIYFYKNDNWVQPL